MSRYLAFVRAAESPLEGPPPEAVEVVEQFMQKCLEAGSLVDRGALLPSKEGFRVRLARGAITVTDGPFTEAKEVIGGWAILELASKAEALRMTRELMELHLKHWPGFEGEAEVRAMYGPEEGP